MLIIKVDNKKGGIEKALKTLKAKTKQTKQVEQLRDRKEFEKPSVKRRKEVLKAIYVEQIKNGLN